jgi:hypothetical protein
VVALGGVAVTDFPTKAAVAVRDDLAPWQRLNVTAFLVSGLVGAAGPEATGAAYEDADGATYLPLLVQPLLVFEASAEQLRHARARASSRGVTLAIYTAEMFSTGNDGDNRAAVRAVRTDDLDLVGIGLRAGHRRRGRGAPRAAAAPVSGAVRAPETVGVTRREPL